MNFQIERRRKVLELLQQDGKVTVAQTADVLGVSQMTARRDIELLDREGLLRRVHGGAVSRFGPASDASYYVRSTQNIGAKRAIGRKAASLISNGETIMLDVGTTTAQIVPFLYDKINLTVVTANLRIAIEIVADARVESNLRLILTGGVVDAQQHSMVGHIPEQTLRDFHVDTAFLGVGGVNVKDGLTVYALEDVRVKRTILENSRRNIVLADGSKFAQTALISYGVLSAVDTIVTDKSAPAEVLEAISAKGVRVIVAD